MWNWRSNIGRSHSYQTSLRPPSRLAPLLFAVFSSRSESGVYLGGVALSFLFFTSRYGPGLFGSFTIRFPKRFSPLRCPHARASRGSWTAGGKVSEIAGAPSLRCLQGWGLCEDTWRGLAYPNTLSSRTKPRLLQMGVRDLLLLRFAWQLSPDQLSENLITPPRPSARMNGLRRRAEQSMPSHSSATK